MPAGVRHTLKGDIRTLATDLGVGLMPERLERGDVRQLLRLAMVQVWLIARRLDRGDYDLSAPRPPCGPSPN